MTDPRVEMMYGTFLAIENEVEVAKARFAELIVDKSIPLNERWRLWCKAPEALYETSTDVWDSKVLEDAEIQWPDLIWTERYRTVYLADVVDSVSAQLKDALKEEILKDNIGSFVYDW